MLVCGDDGSEHGIWGQIYLASRCWLVKQLNDLWQVNFFKFVLSSVKFTSYFQN